MIEYTWEGFWDVSIIFHKPEIEKEKQLKNESAQFLSEGWTNAIFSCFETLRC